jgi:monothiol glutaredoxin
MDEVLKQIDQDIKTNKVILYMKGSKLMPQCGFSARVVHILDELNIEYETKDVLSDDKLRSAIKEYSNWPTLPQLYVDGNFIGGCDIISELYQSGELQKIIVS